MRWWGWSAVLALVVSVMMVAVVEARTPHRPHPPHKARRPRAPRTADGGHVALPPANVRFDAAGTIELPGRGLALAWSPDATRIAVGGRFRERATGLRYDTRVADVASATLEKSFACHYFWVIATAWTQNPFLGEVIADGGGDHAIKLWDPAGSGSATCKPGQFTAADGALRALPEIDGWTTAIAFSPDGRFLAGASRDRIVRVWQLAPGADQFRVVGAIYDREAGNFTSVAWLPHGLVTGDRRGRVVAWDVDLDRDRWDAGTVADFAALSYEDQVGWCAGNAALVSPAQRWSDGEHGWVWNVRVAPAGDRVAGIGTDGLLSVFDAASGGVVYRTAGSRKAALHALDWSPDGALIAAAGGDEDVYVFAADTGAIYDRLQGHADVVSAVAWRPDGRVLASTAGGPRVSLALLNIATGPDQTIRLWTRR